MNRGLLVAGSVLAAGFSCGEAMAQTKFDIKIGGDYFFEAGYVGQDLQDGLRSTEFRNRLRLIVTPIAKADNGLEYGARLRLRAAGGDRLTDADRVYLFANSPYGSLLAGVVDSFNNTVMAGLPVARPVDFLPVVQFDNVVFFLGPTGQSVPGTTRLAGADIFGGPLPTLATSMLWPTLSASGSATKIAYHSPRFAGFQFGGSFTPRSDSSNADVNRVKAASVAGAQFSGNFQDLVEVGVNYSNKFDAWSLGGSLGYQGGKTSASPSATDRFTDLRSWEAGLRVGYGGFAVGGSYTDYGKSGQNKLYGFTSASRNWQVGAQYTVGPVVVGGGYLHGEDPGNLALAGKRSFSAYELGVGYTVAPGLLLQAQYDHFKSDSDKLSTPATGPADDKGNVVLVRSVMVF